jgi:hypothetical protein
MRPVILANNAETAAIRGNQGGMPWPSLDVASRIADWANWLFIGSLVVGVISTVLIAWTANVKERHWDILRQESNERIAEANARASEATQKAEQERIERLKLEAKFAPRLLNDAEMQQFSASVASLSGLTIDVVSYEGLGTDVGVLSNQLAEAMRSVGINARVFTPMGGSGLVRGVVVSDEIGSPAQLDAAVDRMVWALAAVGLSCSKMAPFPIGEVIAGGYMGPTGVAADAKLRVLVGSKLQ